MISFDIIILVGISLATVLIGHLAKWIAEYYLPQREARIGAFAFMLGQAVLPGVLILYDRTIGALAEVAGIILGMVVVWWSFFKRRSINV